MKRKFQVRFLGGAGAEKAPLLSGAGYLPILRQNVGVANE